MDPRLLTALDAGHAIVTASARLARFVRLEVAQAQAARGVSAWTPPSILHFDAWLAREHEVVRWSASGSARVLLNPAQEQRVWEQLIAEDDAADLLATPATARLARAAWNAVHAWRLPDPGQLAVASEDVRAFARWMRAYHARCAEQGWLDWARLPDALRVAWSAGVLAAPPGLLLLGFDQFTPQQRALLRALEKRGTRMDAARGPRHALNAERAELASPAHEIASAGRWAGQLLAQGVARIGILVPRLAERHEAVQRMLDDVLASSVELPGRAGTRRPFSVGTGRPLADHPVVRAARTLQQLVAGRVPFAELTRILRSPFIAGGLTRAPQRALFDAWLREQGVTELMVASFPRWLASFAHSRRSRPDDVALHSRFERVRAVLPEPGAQCAADVWATAIARCLEAFGWPGERALQPHEQQAVAAYHAMLGRFASLELVQGRSDAWSALRQLDDLLARESFRDEHPEAPVQVLDLHDAYGLEFDALWITGLDDETLPAPVDANPFLPLEWQRQHKLPASTPEVQLERAQRLVHRLLTSSDRVIVSHAVRDGDRICAPSALVRALGRRADPALEQVDPASVRSLLPPPVVLETLIDERGPPLAPAEVVRGGTRVLRLQAACPFRAFGELRLHATSLAIVEPGLDAGARGTLLHSALETLWRGLGSHAGLLRLDEAERERAIASAAESALAARELERMAPLGATRRAVEIARLSGALRDWLALEAAREPFTVRDLEAERTVKVGGMELGTRADRIDRLADDSIVIIDYKTGSAEPRAPGCWSGERPDDPQLPLYAIAEETPLGGVFIGRVRRGRPAFSGLAARPGIVPRAERRDDAEAEELKNVRREWRAALGALAQRYGEGDARVDPKHGSQTCRLCGLGALCRVDELRAAENRDD
jgi:probable DNA repair protein